MDWLTIGLIITNLGCLIYFIYHRRHPPPEWKQIGHYLNQIETLLQVYMNTHNVPIVVTPQPSPPLTPDRFDGLSISSEESIADHMESIKTAIHGVSATLRSILPPRVQTMEMGIQTEPYSDPVIKVVPVMSEDPWSSSKLEERCYIMSRLHSHI